MYFLIISLPLFSAIVSGFGAPFIGREGSIRVAVTCMSCVVFCVLGVFYEVGLAGSPCYLLLVNWIDSEMFSINWGFLFDSLTVTMLCVVTIVSLLVHIYSIEYMRFDPHISRFISYLSLFTFFMIILVTADNFLQMFVGWEGVGLCSYLLINFWFTRIQANKAAIKAIVVNRVGDFGLALGIFFILYVFKSLDYSTVCCLMPYQNHNINFFSFEVNSITLITFCLFIGAVGKSAQVGLHTWLPDAMEGPTPVSALIHAATMVTAGVFLIIRCSPLFEYSPQMLLIMTIVGAITAFFAATTGLVQNDLKRVIAYSTCSQLGYMVFACGLSSYSVSVFHLANHAFFKAALFLSAGSIIHAMMDEQDMRRMGGLRHVTPFTYSIILISSLALMGFPFLAGFYSKDVILEVAYAKYTVQSHMAFWLGTISAFCTAFYSIRLLFLTFFAETNVYKQTIEKAHDAPLLMALPLVILTFGSVFIGFLTKDMMIGLGTPFWGNAIYTLPSNSILGDAEFIPLSIKLLPLVFSMSGFIISFVFYEIMSYYRPNFTYLIYNFLNRKWFFDKIYNEFINQRILYYGHNVSYKSLDRGSIELLGPEGLTRAIPRYTKSRHEGYIYYHLFLFFLGLIFIFSVLFFFETFLSTSSELVFFLFYAIFLL